MHRRTLLLKHKRVTEQLLRRDELESSAGATAYNSDCCRRALEREVVAMWGSDELRREKPTPQQEAKGGLAVIEMSLWEACAWWQQKCLGGNVAAWTNGWIDGWAGCMGGWMDGWMPIQIIQHQMARGWVFQYFAGRAELPAPS